MKNNGSIIFIAGGIWQKPFVKYLKDKGHFIAIVNPVVNETTLIADYHIKCDINDLEEINKHIEKLNPIFITSDQSDVSTAIVSRLSERWDLPCNTVDVIEKFTNKFSIYEFGKSIGVNVPETQLVDEPNDIKNFADINGFPVIIKPVDSTMSRGFHKIYSNSAIDKDLLESSVKFSKSGQVIVQKYIPGDMVTLEGVCSGGMHKTIATSIKNEYFKPGVTSGVCYPSDIPEFFLNKIIEANDRYVEMSGMNFGLTHSEFIISEGCFLEDFHLLEIGARGGGAGISNKIVPWVTGINTYDVFYSSLMGNIVDVKNLMPLKRHAWLKYYLKDDPDEEKSKQIANLPGVAEFCFNFIGTQYISDNNDNRYSMGIYLAEGKEEMTKVIENINYII